MADDHPVDQNLAVLEQENYSWSANEDNESALALRETLSGQEIILPEGEKGEIMEAWPQEIFFDQESQALQAKDKGFLVEGINFKEQARLASERLPQSAAEAEQIARLTNFLREHSSELAGLQVTNNFSYNFLTTPKLAEEMKNHLAEIFGQGAYLDQQLPPDKALTIVSLDLKRSFCFYLNESAAAAVDTPEVKTNNLADVCWVAELALLYLEKAALENLTATKVAELRHAVEAWQELVRSPQTAKASEYWQKLAKVFADFPAQALTSNKYLPYLKKSLAELANLALQAGELEVADCLNFADRQIA